MHITDYPLTDNLTNTNVFLVDGEGGTKTILAPEAAKKLLSLLSTSERVEGLDFGELESASLTNGDYFMITRGNEQKKLLADGTLIEQLQNLSINFPALKYSIFRGANLGTAVTDAQWEEIRNGTFRNMFIGDFWEIGGVQWSILDFNYWRRVGSWAIPMISIPEHVLLAPLVPVQLGIGMSKMNEEKTTSGGYVNSNIYTNEIPNKILPIVKSAFGESHLLTHKSHLCNATDNSGNPIGGAWFERIVDIPTEMMLYGHRSLGSRIVPNALIISSEWRQLGYYRIQDKWFIRDFVWLQESVDASRFAVNTSSGTGSYLDANQGAYIVPIFAIKG